MIPKIGLYVGGAIIAALLIWVGFLKFENSGLRSDLKDVRADLTQCSSDRDRAIDTNADVTKRIGELTEERDAAKKRAAEAVKTLEKDRATLNEKLATIERNIRNAPPSSNGAVAPVLRDALDGLRNL